MRDPAVDIIILSWNGRDDTLTSLEGVVGQIGSGDDQEEKAMVTVVDNGSTDGTAEAIRIRFPTVRILRLEENRGFTGGIMHAIANSWAPYAIFLNNDAIPEPGWLKSSVDAIRHAADDVIAIGGRITDLSGELADFVGGIMTFDGHGFQPGFRKPLHSVAESEDRAEIFFACGGNMIVRRRAFQDLGGFDDAYFAYLEDVDFGWRSWLAGWRTLYNRQASVRHKSSATSDRLGNFERGSLFERNALQTVIKNFDEEHLVKFAGPVLLTLLHRLLRYTIDRNPNTESLRARPIQSGDSGGNRSILSRLFSGGLGAPTITDNLTQMQFRAVEWVLDHQDQIIEKRSEVQILRKRTDLEIFAKFPLHYVPTYPGDEALMRSPLFRLLRPQGSSVDLSIDEIMGKS